MKTDSNDNFIEFDKNLYVYKFELTNVEYNIFLKEIKAQKDEAKLLICLPDSTQWVKRTDYSYNEPYTNLYHWHPAYNNYPVVNLTKEAVELYCEWATSKYNDSKERRFKKVKFRLPTEKEWMKFSSPMPGLKLPWIGNLPYVLDKKGILTPLANVKVKDYAIDKDNYVMDGAMITCAVGNYKENKLGLYDIIGNAAEYTSDGKVKGGSWYNYPEECHIDISQEYTLPDPRVGFRLVMEVIEK